MVCFSNLKLSNFRNYAEAKLLNIDNGLIVLFGKNGAGKTNILEALSLFSPGRGLRNAKVIDMQNSCASNPWAVAGELQTGYGSIQLGTGLDTKTEKRTIRIQGETVRGQSKLSEYLSILWLTPQMDRLFLDSSRERRKFLDRMIFAFDPGHAGRVTRYENALSQRSKLLKEGRSEPIWIDGLEAQMSETGVSIAAARLDFTQRLQSAKRTNEDCSFPLGLLRARGTLEELLNSAPALEVEELFKYQLAQSRGVDALTGGAATGPHKSDFKVIYAEKNMPADQCSTGEQKALLIGLVLAHARLIKAETGAPPILLLDEVAAHLDEGRRTTLYDILNDLNGQVWLTGTDKELFKAIEYKAQFKEIKNSQILT